MIRALLLIALFCGLFATLLPGEARPNETAALHYAGVFVVDLESNNYQSVKQTDQVPAALGQVFGIYYSVSGASPGKRIIVVERIRRGDWHESVYTETTTGGGNIVAFGFDEVEELVPGNWVFEVLHGGELLLSHTFEVQSGPIIPTGQTDGIVQSVCERQRVTGSNRRVKVCRPPAPEG